MPIKSEAQRRFLHASNPDLARKFEAETPKGANLPERVNDRSSVPPDDKQDKKKTKKKKTKKRVEATQESLLLEAGIGYKNAERLARILSGRRKQMAVSASVARKGMKKLKYYDSPIGFSYAAPSKQDKLHRIRGKVKKAVRNVNVAQSKRERLLTRTGIKEASVDSRRSRLLNRIKNPSDRDKNIAAGTAGAAVGAAIPQAVSRTIHHPYKVADKIMTELVNKNIKNKTLYDKAVKRSSFRSRALKHSAWRMRRKAPTTMKVLAGVTAILGASKASKASRRKPTNAQ